MCVCENGAEDLDGVCDRPVEKGYRFVVFLHVDLRRDGLIGAAACYWHKEIGRNAGSDTTTRDPRNFRAAEFFCSSDAGPNGKRARLEAVRDAMHWRNSNTAISGNGGNRWMDGMLSYHREALKAVCRRRRLHDLKLFAS